MTAPCDRSGEAGETRSGSAEGESAVTSRSDGRRPTSTAKPLPPTDDVRARALEEAARAAESQYAGHGAANGTARARNYEHAGTRIAAAIRALSAQSPPPADDRAELQLIDERDAAEAALGDAYTAVTGRPAEWSSLFGYREAVDEIRDAMTVQSPPPAGDEADMREKMRRGEYVPPMRAAIGVCGEDGRLSFVPDSEVQSPPPIMGEGLVERLRDEAEGLHRAELDSGPRMPLESAMAVMNEAADRLETLESWASGPNGVKWYTDRYAEQQAEIERLTALATPSLPEGMVP